MTNKELLDKCKNELSGYGKWHEIPAKKTNQHHRNLEIKSKSGSIYEVAVDVTQNGHIRVHFVDFQKKKTYTKDDFIPLEISMSGYHYLKEPSCTKCKAANVEYYPMWYHGKGGAPYFGFQWHSRELNKEFDKIKECVDCLYQFSFNS